MNCTNLHELWLLVFIGGAVRRGDFSRSRALLEMIDNYRSGGDVEFFACFVMIFAINSKNPAKTSTFLQNQQPHLNLYVNFIKKFRFSLTNRFEF